MFKCVRGVDLPKEFNSEGLAKIEMLPGSHKDVKTYRCNLKAGCTVRPEVSKDLNQIFFFVSGTGYITTPKCAYNITESAVFIPDFNKEEGFAIYAADCLEYLQIDITLTEEDKATLFKSRYTLPRFKLLSECDRYEEGFKTENVISYSVVLRRRLARASMGVVYAPGPDKVGTHTHDVLQQWFYGLKGADYEFTAGDETTHIGEGDWAYIPEKTPHSVDTKPGGLCNYVWFELDV